MRTDAHYEPDCEHRPGQRARKSSASSKGSRTIQMQIVERARARGEALLDAHVRVRTATKGGLGGLSVRVHEPPDLLGVYVFLPDAKGAAT